MDTATILELVKDRLGISTTARDTYLISIIESVIRELEDEKEITINYEDMRHTMFITDFVAWRYKSRDETGAMPRHLQFRLHNLVIHDSGGIDV